MRAIRERLVQSKGHPAKVGAVGRRGNIAVVERFHFTLKQILRLSTMQEDQAQFAQKVDLAIAWYNEHRPHETLGGKTPNEVYLSQPPANEQPRIEPRSKWPRGSPSAKPQVQIDGQPGDAIIVEIDCLQGRSQQPVVRWARLIPQGSPEPEAKSAKLSPDIWVQIVRTIGA